jgi:tetratricopeptide (TPR) repeat protein
MVARAIRESLTLTDEALAPGAKTDLVVDLLATVSERPALSAENWLAVAKALGRTLGTAALLAALERALSVQPNDVAALAFAANAFRQLGQLDDAARIAREATAADPTRFEGYFELAVVLIEQNDLDADLTVKHAYFVVQSTTSEREGMIEAFLRSSSFRVVPNDQIIGEFEEAKDAKHLLAAFSKLVLIAPDRYHPTFAAFCEKALRFPDPKVRAKALGLVTYMEWPELKVLIDELSRDPEPQVRRNAQRVLGIYKKLGIA